MKHRLLVTALIVVGFAQAGELRPRRGKLWWVSVAALTAASVLDAHSSWNKPELNPLLRRGDGRFGASGIGVKSAIVGGSVGLQWIFRKHEPRAEKALAIANFGMASVTTAVAVRNSR